MQIMRFLKQTKPAAVPKKFEYDVNKAQLAFGLKAAEEIKLNLNYIKIIDLKVLESN